MHELCDLHELPEGTCRGETVNGHSVFAVHLRGEMRVYRNRCPHMGVHLHWMEHKFLDRSGQHIQCMTHGALFRPEDGFCIEGPCKGASLEALEHERVNGKLYVYL